MSGGPGRRSPPHRCPSIAHSDLAAGRRRLTALAQSVPEAGGVEKKKATRPNVSTSPLRTGEASPLGSRRRLAIQVPLREPASASSQRPSMERKKTCTLETNESRTITSLELARPKVTADGTAVATLRSAITNGSSAGASGGASSTASTRLPTSVSSSAWPAAAPARKRPPISSRNGKGKVATNSRRVSDSAS